MIVIRFSPIINLSTREADLSVPQSVEVWKSGILPPRFIYILTVCRLEIEASTPLLFSIVNRTRENKRFLAEK
jgi:hypothetical protein